MQKIRMQWYLSAVLLWHIEISFVITSLSLFFFSKFDAKNTSENSAWLLKINFEKISHKLNFVSS